MMAELLSPMKAPARTGGRRSDAPLLKIMMMTVKRIVYC
jgi:hypothetical protein